jgi:hypothetical protein
MNPETCRCAGQWLNAAGVAHFLFLRVLQRLSSKEHAMKKWTEALAAVANTDSPLTSRDLAAKVGIDYRRNFNKREARYARKLAGFVVRRHLTSDEIATWRTNWPPPRKVLYWLLADEWKGQLAIDIVRSFEART